MVEPRRYGHDQAVLVQTVGHHGIGEEVLAPELLAWRLAEHRIISVAIETGFAAKRFVRGAETGHTLPAGFRIFDLDRDKGLSVVLRCAGEHDIKGGEVVREPPI